MRQREQQHISGAMAAQVIGDGIDPLDPFRDPVFDLVQEGHPVAGAPARVGPRDGSTRCRAEGAEDVAFAASAVVDLLSSPARGWGVRSNQAPAQIALGADGPHLVQADHYAALRRGGVKPLDAPLFSANSGSTRSPNQVSWRRQRKPSLSRISPIRLRRMAMPLCSSEYAASRSSVHDPKGRPRRRGLVSAAAITTATSSVE